MLSLPEDGAIGPRELMLLFAATGLLAAGIGVVILGREYLTFGAESDFLAGFYREAQRFLHGRPLRLEFHPPLYPITVGSLSQVAGGWIGAGLLVSWVSGTAALLCNFWFFRMAAGPAAGWGAFVGAATSPIYLSYWAQATSDIFFFALYSAALLVAVVALTKDDRRSWLLLGMAVGAGIMARSNGAVLLLLVLTPLAVQRKSGGQLTGDYPRLKRAALVAAGAVLPLAAWVTHALATGSNLVPQSNYANLALAYFGDSGGLAAENRLAMEARFSGVIDVLTHDPARMLKVYARNLRNNFVNVFEVNHQLAFPIAHLAVLGGLYFPLSSMRLKCTYAALTGAHFLLVSVMPYHRRFFIFAVPFVGALAGLGLARMRWPVGRRATRLTGIALVAGTLVLGVYPAVSRMLGNLREDQRELRTAVPAVKEQVDRAAVVVSRKPHIPFYTGSGNRYFPDVRSVSELRRAVSGWNVPGTVFLYFGSEERETRPGVAEVDDPERAPGWLRLVAENRDPRWLLYRVRADSVP